MTSSRWRLVLIKCKYEPKFITFLLAAIRVLICWWPQTGYLHPDEFFQSTDVGGGRYFKSHVEPVWEFLTDRPIRCMLIPTMLNTLAFKLATLIQTNPSGYLLLVMPRLIYTLTSFIIDACLYKLCRYYSSRGLWYLPVSIVFQTSFICLGCLTRTLSNTPEVILFALLLVVVCQLIRPRFRILFVTPTRSRPAHEQVKASTQLTSSTLVGILVTLGTFNRPTFPCFALVPMLYWISESFKRNAYNRRLNIQRVLIPVAISSSLTVVLLSTYDTFYYSSDINIMKNLFNHLISFQFSQAYDLVKTNWIITPYNFILYNTNANNLERFGLHKPYTHMLVNIPFAFNILGLMFYAKLINLMVGSGVYRLLFSTHRIYALMLLSVLTSTILLSFIPHQEFRFLMPLIVPLVYAFAYNIYASNRWLLLWLLSNLIITYFYAAIHQAGTISASLELDSHLKAFVSTSKFENKTLVDVIALRCYLVPSYHWNVPLEDQRFHFQLQETMDDFSESLGEKLSVALDRHRSAQFPLVEQRIYFMLPDLYLNQLTSLLKQQLEAQNLTTTNWNQNNLQVLRQYAPHFSGEELGESLAHLRAHGLSSWRHAFGFSLAQTDLIIHNNHNTNL